MLEVTVLPHTIVLKGGKERHDEGRAAAAIDPGMLVSRDAASALIPHPTAGAEHLPTFAIEDAFLARTIATQYQITELVRIVYPQEGDEIYAWLKGGEVVTPADTLMSAGDGSLAKTTGAGAVPKYKPLESLNLTALPKARIKVRVMG